MNIRVDLNTPIKDGMDVKFRSPVDCSQITGLIVYYNGEFREFAFADAHGNNVGDIDHLFAENVVVKVILDVTTGMAFVQNADTNAYLEGRFQEIEDKIGTGGGSATETDSKYFLIDYDGKISLKPEYRGDSVYGASNQYPFSISDNGSGVEGSKINELPEIIVIPKNVDGQEVTGFQNGIFCCNKRVKEITIPKTIKKIPGGFTREAIHFEKLINTEQIVEIGSGAFQVTRIRELICPNLTTLGNNVFKNASCLIRVNLGTITAIPKATFQYCENLTEVVADKVTSIVDAAFYATRRLKCLPFIAKVKSIASSAFWSSRCDLESLPDNCTFGTSASYKQFNSTDYWTGVAFTPCKNQLGSLFHQKDPRWVDKEIKYTDKTGKTWVYKTNGETGDTLKYGSNGCAFITLAEIYSAFMGVKFESPEDFLPVLEEAGALGIPFRNDRTEWCQIANKLGFETEYLTSINATNLKKLYDALASGALLYRSTVGNVESGSADGGHAILAYGINTDGEMLCSDSSMHCYEVGIYENHLNAWHVYKHGSPECDCVIVKKPTA